MQEIWTYRREGNACVALACEKQANVLLISKRKTRDNTEICHTQDQVRQLECEVWSDFPGFTPDLSYIERRAWFSEYVFRSYLQHTDALSPVQLIKLVDREVDADTKKAHPCCVEEEYGLLLPDATRFDGLDGDIIDPTNRISIEIKPKSAAMPTKRGVINPSYKLKYIHSRYQLYQHLKVSQGQIRSVSSYDPRDLFAVEPESKLKALSALLENPQNNFVLYRNSHCLFPLDSAQTRREVEKECALSFSDIIQMLVKILIDQQCTLDAIKYLQEMDIYDIEGIHILYENLLGSKDVPIFEGDLGYEKKVEELLNLSHGEAIKAIQNYLIASTAKDCSFIITMAKLQKDNINPQLPPQYEGKRNVGFIHMNAGVRYLYKMEIIDTDMKPLEKITAHHTLDRKILLNALKCIPCRT